MQEELINYKLEVFEGPLDLLLSLIAKNKIDIYDIPIALIFEQYMDYIESIRELNMDVACEFIVMASELMLIKSRMLLPKQVIDGVEIDPREDLVQTLIEYQRAKQEAVFLGDRYAQFFGRYIKETDEVGVDKNFVSDQETEYLLRALEKMLIRIKIQDNSRNDESLLTLGSIINRRPTPVHDRVEAIMGYLKQSKKMSFEEIILKSRSRSEIIASFMALLQLISSQKIIAVYNDDDNPIIVLKEETA